MKKQCIVFKICSFLAHGHGAPPQMEYIQVYKHTPPFGGDEKNARFMYLNVSCKWPVI